MKNYKHLIVGSRGSTLALRQTQTVIDHLRSVYPEYQFSLKKIKTKGDITSKLPYGSGEQGFFVKELEEALLSQDIDIAVHSLKDVPTVLTAGLELAAICHREEPNDALVSRSNVTLDQLPKGALLGTGSLRRIAQVKAFRQDIRTISIRGNVDTRIRKIETESLDGVILATAALVRMGWSDRISQRIPLEVLVPAPGQGALAIETRMSDQAIELIRHMEHKQTRLETSAERAFLRGLGGGCRVPIAALGKASQHSLELEGLVISPDGNELLRGKESGSDPEELGQGLANKLLKQGAAQLLERAESWMSKE
ncbi:MAG: hydroxymethylbilane synthase [Chloroflexota bacterium]|nr:hydroxymethylbilane synthase [Chloroflexota bacterium]